MWGIDTAADLSNSVSCLQGSTIEGNPISFVIRYYGGAYAMSQSEATALSNGGFQLMAVWEVGSAASYFTYNQGVSDGEQAFEYADLTIGQPQYTPVYFAVDTTAATKTAVENYFNGVVQGRINYQNALIHQGLTAKTYEIGVYGDNNTLNWVSSAGLASYFWEMYAPKVDTTKFASDNVWQKSGVTPQLYVCGGAIPVDADEAFSTAGFWTI